MFNIKLLLLNKSLGLEYIYVFLIINKLFTISLIFLQFSLKVRVDLSRRTKEYEIDGKYITKKTV